MRQVPSRCGPPPSGPPHPSIDFTAPAASTSSLQSLPKCLPSRSSSLCPLKVSRGTGSPHASFFVGSRSTRFVDTGRLVRWPYTLTDLEKYVCARFFHADPHLGSPGNQLPPAIGP